MADKFEIGLKNFRSAEKIFKTKIEPVLYRGISLINMGFKLHRHDPEMMN